jgi:hypothetical protein
MSRDSFADPSIQIHKYGVGDRFQRALLSPIKRKTSIVTMPAWIFDIAGVPEVRASGAEVEDEDAMGWSVVITGW